MAWFRMPKITWRKFLKNEVKLRPGAERKMRFEIRQRAQKCIEDLNFILTNLEDSKKSENEFAKIFENEKQYFSLIETMQHAYDKSYQVPIKLANHENWRALKLALLAAGVKYDGDKALYDSNYRLEMVRKLKQMEKANGTNHLERMQRMILLSKEKGVITGL